MRMSFPAVAFTLLAGVCQTAWGGDGDVGLRVEGGVITTWLADHNPVHFEHRERAFVGDLDLHGGVVEGEEPGFLIEAGSPLGGHTLGFNIRAAARAWDVAGQHFHNISPLAITVEKSLLGSVTTPASDPASPIPGLSFVVPTGGADFHYDFVLGGNAAGLYLLELEKWSTAPGVGTSSPFWIILNYDMSHHQEEAAEAWVRQYLVPAPGALAVLSLAGVAGLRRRR
jgi:hypothetical protein